jgi:predicted phage tail protein
MAAGQEVAVEKGFGSLSEGGNAPLPPVLLLPAPATGNLPIKLEAVPIAFNMPAQDGAVAWLGKVSTEPQFNSILAENLSQGSNLSFNDMPDGKYYLKVRAKDKQGLEGYDATHEFNLNARPFAPVANTPAASATVREANPELTWTKIEQANEYLLELARDADFKQMLDSKRVANPIYKIEKNLEPGQYYWRLASLDGADQGPYAAASSFTYKAKPNAPDISQLKIEVLRNKVFVNTINPPEGLTYEAILHNEVNKQTDVWRATGLQGEFDFLLKEYGKQTLLLRLVDADGVAGPDAVYEFNASPQ